MKAAVRYFSRGGNVKAMAEALAEGAGVEAISVDEPGAQIEEDVEVLFIGGALYNYGLDKHLVEYLLNLPEGKIERAVCFGSSFLTRRCVYLIQEKIKNKGIKVCAQAIYSRHRPKPSLLDACRYFAKAEIERDTSLDGLSPYERTKAIKIAAAVQTLEEVEEESAERNAKIAAKEAAKAAEKAAEREEEHAKEAGEE